MTNKYSRLRFNFFIFDNMFSLTYGTSPAVLLLLLMGEQFNETVDTSEEFLEVLTPNDHWIQRIQRIYMFQVACMK